MKRALDIADLALKVLSCLAIIGGGIWAYYQFDLAGATNWQSNLSIETQVLPYRDNLRLLVVHVKSKNPRNVSFRLVNKDGDSFVLRVQRVPDDAKTNTLIAPDKRATLVPDIDLLADTGGEYEFAPNAEMDDMRTIALKVGSTVVLTADMEAHNGTLDEHGKPDTDFVSTSTVVHIGP
ncbi:hypothetical protein [Burkholderia vietnamiensis]|uniref:hypothetical protein n=1 Tax=Burkholderia vietnamiensis TaxID=60552 RepID=UPI00075CF7E1|nr:hypothetical protein [Burkholderia vietnamiensis]KVF00811.1 hypothetical protein WJ04_02235 [Burkholderia vietnamiensis]MDN7816500.1 hypothetical protein [Burkholderia vietnamiensis]HDR9084571.1 hypothetical protein [Burkholderia vietnamiensis]